MNFFMKEKIKITIISIALIVIGILFCALPEKSLELIETILAIGLIVVGVIFVLCYCCAPEFSRGIDMLFFGVVFSALGILIIFIPAALILGIGIVAAIWGINKTGESLKKRELGDNRWWLDFSLGLLVFALSIVLIVFRCTSIASSIIMIYLGISLIVDGIINIIFIYGLKRTISKIRKKVSSENSNNDDKNMQDFTDYSIN